MATPNPQQFQQPQPFAQPQQVQSGMQQPQGMPYSSQTSQTPQMPGVDSSIFNPYAPTQLDPNLDPYAPGVINLSNQGQYIPPGATTQAAGVMQQGQGGNAATLLPPPPTGYQTWDDFVKSQSSNQQTVQQLQQQLAEMRASAEAQNQIFTTLLDKMGSGNFAGQPRVDYLQMSSDQLLDLINGSEDGSSPSRIADILRSVRDQAVQSVSSQYEEQFKTLQNKLDAVARQHNSAQSEQAVAALASKYQNSDPRFKEHLEAVSKTLLSNDGIAAIQQFSGGGVGDFVEKLYLMEKAKSIADPAYAQQMAAQAMQLAQSIQHQKMQAGFNPQANQQPTYASSLTNPLQNKQQYDAQVLQTVLQHQNLLSVPSVA